MPEGHGLGISLINGSSYFSNNANLPGLPFHSSASGRESFTSVMIGHCLASSAFSAAKCSWPWQFVFRVDGVGWALGFTEGAIDTFVGIDNQKIGTFMKAIDGAYVNAVGKFAFDAVFGDYKSHIVLPRLGK